MADFKEVLQNVKKTLSETLGEDTPKETLDKRGEVDKMLDCLEGRAETLRENYESVKNDYINEIKYNRHAPTRQDNMDEFDIETQEGFKKSIENYMKGN